MLYKIGASKFGSITLQRFLNLHFWLEYLFTPTIFAALALLFLGKFFAGSPLSAGGALSVFTIITVLSLVFTAILEWVMLRKTYDPLTYVAIAIALICVMVIGRGIV